MKQQTAMQELIDELYKLTKDQGLDPMFRAGVQCCIAAANMKIEKERQQMIKFYNYGCEISCGFWDESEQEANYYYNESYGFKKEGTD